MAGRRTWLEGQVDVLLVALANYGMDTSEVSARGLIQERVEWVATNMRISPTTAGRYPDWPRFG